MRKYILGLVLLIFVLSAVVAQTAKKEVKFGPYNGNPRQDLAMKKWRANRFGQFIHWGISSIPGGVWRGETYLGAAEWLKSSAKVSDEEWKQLIHEFSIEKYNPKEWAAIAKDMGVKYVTFTTKHHDGFCMWPSKYTDFDIEATPYKKDLLGELVKEYTNVGIDVNFYYSILDWNHPGWRYDIKSEEDAVAFETLMEYSKNQLLELIECYPEVKGFWFDGTWDKSWKKNGKFSFELEKAMKEASPGLVISSRLRADEFGSRHLDSNGNLMGDYYSVYERRLPLPWDEKITKMDWECCMTVPVNQWGYHKDWSLSYVKTPMELTEMLVQSVSQNGNFLLNFGPMGNGDIRKEERYIAKEIGKWMDVNGETIYNCEPSGLQKQDWGYFTKPMNKENKVNMVIFNKPLNGRYKVKLPKGKLIYKAYLLSNPEKKIKVMEIDRNLYYILPEEMKNEQPFVIVLELMDKNSKKISKKVLT